MILNHLWGLYAHPRSEWRRLDAQPETLSHTLAHLLLVALIPAVCSYYATVFIGWQIGTGDPLRLTSDSALMMAIAMYGALISGVFALAALALWMARTFGAEPRFQHTLELATYAATPLMMVGFAALYPVLWFCTLAGIGGLAYSVYLLYSGVPILMHIPEERGFIYASSLVTAGLVLLVCLMTATVLLWSWGLGPVFTH